MARQAKPAMKVCVECGENKLLSEYYHDKRRAGSPGEYRAECRDCTKKLRRDRYQVNGGEREEKLLQNYRISEADYGILFDLQRGRCAGCGVEQYELERMFVVDHNHATGMTRGLLCYGCNQVLGLVGDNSNTLRSLADYLDADGYAQLEGNEDENS
jgi:hypothetical protein